MLNFISSNVFSRFCVDGIVLRFKFFVLYFSIFKTAILDKRCWPYTLVRIRWKNNKGQTATKRSDTRGPDFPALEFARSGSDIVQRRFNDYTYVFNQVTTMSCCFFCFGILIVLVFREYNITPALVRRPTINPIYFLRYFTTWTFVGIQSILFTIWIESSQNQSLQVPYIFEKFPLA